MKSMTVFKGTLMALSLVLSWVGTAQAEDVISGSGNGGINWSEGIIYANGYGVAPENAADRKKRLLARRAAQVDAYRNLAEIMSGVRVNSETIVKDMQAASDIVRTKLDALVRGAIMVKDHYQNEVAQVRMEIDMDGPFYDTIKRAPSPEKAKLPELLHKGKELLGGSFRLLAEGLLGRPAIAAEAGPVRLLQSVSDLSMAKRWQKRLEQVGQERFLQQLEKEIDNLAKQSGFTGLLIDASEVSDFKLATIPRIRTEDGRIVYPGADLLDGAALARRPVSYDFDVRDAIRHERVAIHPMIVKARGVYESRFSDLVISDKEAELVSNNEVLLAAIRKAGVMIVVGE